MEIKFRDPNKNIHNIDFKSDPHKRRLVGVYGFAAEGTADLDWYWACPICAAASDRGYVSHREALRAFNVHQHQWCDES